MSLKDSLRRGVSRVSNELVPAAVRAAGEKVEEFRQRLDHLNRTLAERALPGDRKARVSELSLRRKARDAGQKDPALKVVDGKNSNKRAR
ncbi:hypothetical protein [Marinobacter lipolyticus]|uniref:hypothetical protein n=1 Tax=Marinobacter lipolyticus TaxID=209639 RepID=UPI003A8CFD41